MSGESKIESAVRALLNPVIEGEGYELVEVAYKKEGKDWFLRLFIDHENGIGLDDCQKISRAVDGVLDEADLVPHSYLLEVSSPGLERPLKKITDYQRFSGQKAEIKLFQPEAGSRRIVGIIQGVNDGQIMIETESGQRQVPFEQIASAHLVFEF